METNLVKTLIIENKNNCFPYKEWKVSNGINEQVIFEYKNEYINLYENISYSTIESAFNSGIILV